MLQLSIAFVAVTRLVFDWVELLRSLVDRIMEELGLEARVTAAPGGGGSSRSATLSTVQAGLVAEAAREAGLPPGA